MNLEATLRAAFARHEDQTPPTGPLLSAINARAAVRRRRRARLGTAAIALAAVLVLAVPAAWAGGLLGGHPEARPADSPAPAPDGPVNVLVVGSDERPAVEGRRADLVMVAHIPADRSAAYLVSLPRDLSVDGRKLSAVYRARGAAGLRDTVETLTGVRLDATVEVQFDGLTRVVDALGGVRLCVETPPGTDSFRSIHPPYRTFRKGCRVMNGERALDYVRQRMQFPEGDFARIRHQQQLIRAMLAAAVESGAMKQPAQLVGTLRDATAMDGEPRLLALAAQIRHLRPDDLVGVRAPTETVVHDGIELEQPQRPDFDALWRAVRQDGLDVWVTDYPDWVHR